MITSYKKLLETLNVEQRQAVEAIDGPLLIVAGPGTGKTQILSSRVANILTKTDVDASTVLCLTFTSKAAANMRERLIRIAGPSANKVNVKTFHSFAAEIINIYPDYFFNGARLSVASDALQLDVIENILDNLPHNNPLTARFGGAYTMIGDIDSSLKLVKEAGLTPDKLRALIAANLEYIDIIEPKMVDALSPALSRKRFPTLQKAVSALPEQAIGQMISPLLPLSTAIKESFAAAFNKDAETNKTAALSKWKSRWVQSVQGRKGMYAERKSNMWWLALAEFYEEYRSLLHAKKFYDYADMLVEVNAVLEQNPDVLSDLQERFNYILIDEFQDTNPAQLRLAQLVADSPSTEGKPNIMAVGDDDQAIFRFQGAELNNILHFKRHYKNMRLVVLKDSYRSSHQILDTSQKVIAQAEQRLVNIGASFNKNLRAVRPPKEKGQIVHYTYLTRDQQFSEVAKQIKIIRKNNKNIAVLARNHDGLVRMSAVLNKIGVPTRYERQKNILEHPAIQLVHNIAKAAEEIRRGDIRQTNFYFSRILRHPAWGVDPKILWRLALNNQNKSWLDSALKSNNNVLTETATWLLWLASTCEQMPLPLAMEYIVGLRQNKSFTSPLREFYLKEDAGGEYLHALSALQLLRASAEEFALKNDGTLSDFARLIDISATNNKVITDESPFVSAKDAVELLTVFKAKGLEFDIVFLIDAVENNWQPKPPRRRVPSNLPLKQYGEELDDYARMMYVAITRARHSFISASYAQDHAGNFLITTPLILNSLAQQKTILSDDSIKPIEVLEQNLTWPELSKADERETLKLRMEGYNLSSTALINFLDVSERGPKYFKERNILHLPEAKTPHLSYGTAIHAALELAQVLTNKNEFSLSAIIKQFQKVLREEYLPESDFKKYFAKGKATIENLFKNFGFKLPKGALPEQKINDIRIADALLSGKLDRIEINGSKLEITDYKTGAVKKIFTNNKSQQVAAWRLRTQLIFYELLAQNSPRFKNISDISCQLIFVEAENASLLTLDYKPEQADVDRLAQLINAVWNKIIRLDLPDTKKYTCDYQGIKQFEDDLINGNI